LYRTLALDEYIEFEWDQVQWIANYPKFPGAPTTSTDTGTSTGTGTPADTGTSTDTGTSAGTGTPADPPPPRQQDFARVTVWLKDTAIVSVGGFLVGDIAHMYMPLDDVTAAFGQRAHQIQEFLDRNSLVNCSPAGCSTNPQCNGQG
jgi:hypothetical protein